MNAVTLELTPEESERLDLARSIGSLSLVLRNEMDTTVVQSEGQRLVDLTNLSAMVEESQPKPAGVSELPNTNPTQKKVPKRSKSVTKTKVDLVEEIRGVKESEGAK